MKYYLNDAVCYDTSGVLPPGAIPLTDEQYGQLCSGSHIMVDGILVPVVASNIALKLAALDSLYQQKLYSNVDALFPSGTKTIQLRNDDDYRSFERVVLAAITRQAAKREDAIVQFRTEDNTTQELPASEFVPVALDVLDAKQALWLVRTAHKDTILGLTEEQAATYDITTDWPETNEPVWVQLERANKGYKDLIRRRASRLDSSTAEGQMAAILLLKTIGE